jgi:stage II sporulation protein P
MRPITVRNSRYNQHTTPGSLLVEMGAAGNSLDEALLSARLLGKAIAEVMGEA